MMDRLARAADPLLRSLHVTTGAPALLLGALIALGLAFAGCADETSDQFQAGSNAKLSVSPSSVTFQPLRPGETATQTVIVENVGEGTLILPFGEDGYSLEPESAPFVFKYAMRADGVTTERLDPGEEAAIEITYLQPDEEGRDYSATLRLNATNGDTASVLINTVRPAPLLEVDPNPVVFNDVSPGTTGERVVTVANRGTADLNISRIVYQPENTIDFSVDFSGMGLPEGETATVLAPEESFELVVSYVPSGDENTTDRGHLLVFSNAGGGTDGQTDVEIIGSVAGPRIEIEPGSVNFGAVELATLATRELIVRNIGDGTLEVSSIYLNFDSSTDFSYDDAATLTLEEGEETSVLVGYTPVDPGTDTGFLVFESNDVIQPGVLVALQGVWAGPDLVVKPLLLNFGRVTAGVQKQLTFDVFNEGTLPLTIEQFNERDWPAGSQLTYTVDSGDTVPFDIEGGGKRRVTVTFAPTESLAPSSSFLEIVSNDPQGPSETVEMRYEGVLDGDCEVRVVPTDVNFGLVPGGYTSIQQVAVQNVGSAPCRVDSIQISADFSNWFYGNPFSLVTPFQAFDVAPGDTTLVDVLYAPYSGDTDQFAAQMVFYVSDPLNGTTSLACPSASGSPFPGQGGCVDFGSTSCWACLTGSTGDPALAAVPAHVDFGLVTLGCSSQNTRVRIYNKGTAPTDIQNVSLASTCPSSFALAGVPPTPFTVQPGDYAEVEVTFTPAGTAAEACTMLVQGTTETLSVPLSGEGTTDENVTDIFEQIDGRKVDVLFVVDNSGSMGDEQTNLANNFSSFIQSAVTWGVDFNIGVTTTDDSDEGKMQSRNGKPRIIRSSVMTDSEVQAAFSDNIQVGTNGSASERGLKAGEHALSAPKIIDDVPGDCPGSPNANACQAPYSCDTVDQSCGGYNARFLRDDAALEVIFVSDEQDQSPAAINYYVDFFKNIKGFANNSLFHAHAIVGYADGSGNCNTSGFQRYSDVATATGGQIEPLCGNFATALANIGNNAFGLRVQFFLSRVPEPATITVTVDGMAVSSGWAYDSTSNSVIFDTAPAQNSTIQVDYKAACY